MDTDWFRPPEPNQPWVDKYEGLTLDAALAEAKREGRRVRVMHPGSAIHADRNRNRLNLLLNADGEIERIASG